ncbi:MAG: right-handed parallel beta-helix repeat-containing protein [Deltaproteobacteria bacterium]|nr:right-handed parallel beta-helix repeat-containing protein [Deltaproteobacteria bacterium]
MPLVACDDAEPTINDAESLTAALGAAVPGDRICLAEGVFMGAFEVPAGVELCGAGRGLTHIIGPSDRPVITATPGVGGPTRITGLTISATRSFGVISIGGGELEIMGVDVAVETTGAGIGVEGLAALRMQDVNVLGPANRVNAVDMPAEMDVTLSAAYGVVAVSVMSVEGDAVEVSGFAHFGVLTIDSNLELRDSNILMNLSTGLMVYGGTADLSGVHVDEALGGTRLIPPYNAVFAHGADVTTNALEVSAGDGYGILQSEATSTHDGLVSVGNSEAAIWVQDSGGLSLTNSTITDNRLAGIVAVATSDLSVVNVEIARTLPRTRIFDRTPVMVGDGIQLLGSTTGISLERLTLSDNTRVGVLFDLEGADFSGIDIASVTVDGTGAELGAIAQDGTIPAGWDANVTRSPLIDANDSAFAGALQTVGIVGPSDLPAVDAIAMSGIAGIVGPSD